MIYELAFERKGQDYYLAGRKEVQDDPGFDLWKDTTLLTQLHRGVDKTGPVIGAGFVTLLSPTELLENWSQLCTRPTPNRQKKCGGDPGVWTILHGGTLGYLRP